LSDIVSSIENAVAKYDDVVLTRNMALKKASDFSDEKISELRAHIAQSPPPAEPSIHSLAVAGSLARREASSLSDLDLIVSTVSMHDDLSVEYKQSIDNWRFGLCDNFKMERHNPKGVFASPIGKQALASIAGGSDEHYSSVAKRMLFVLESVWLYNEENYNRQLDAIINAYSEDVRADPRKNFVFLLNDVVRFFRALCVNYQYNKSGTNDGKWPIRNIKLRHSRVIMYFSMVAAIGALSREHTENKIPALRLLIEMPPLKRMFVCYELAGDTAFYKVAGFYNTFLSLLSDRDVREGLQNLEYNVRYNSPEFAHLKTNSDGFSSELLRFYEARRGEWDDRFFEYMII
jgi:hypothetical protein